MHLFYAGFQCADNLANIILYIKLFEFSLVTFFQAFKYTVIIYGPSV